MASARRPFDAPGPEAIAPDLHNPAGWSVARALIETSLDLVPLPVCVVREPGLRIELANHAFRRLSIDGQPVGKPIRNCVSDVWVETLANDLAETMRTGTAREQSAQPDSTALRGRDGRYYDWTFWPVCALSADVRAAVILAYDVTQYVDARRQAERALHAAEEARGLQDEFFKQLAHELRSPLAPITTALQLARQSDVSEVERAYVVIERQTKQLARLIDDVFDLSRDECRGLTIHCEPVSLSAVTERAVESVAPLLHTHRHGVQIDVAEDLLVYGDPGRLMQVMSNLLTNAAKYMSDGGSIRIGARRVHDEIVVSVIDRGIGITRDMLPRVFDRFVQAPDARLRSHGGVGLGLHIVRSLVREHGGSVEVQSEGPGRGSTFTVRLPAIPGPSEDLERGSKARETSTRLEPS